MMRWQTAPNRGLNEAYIDKNESRTERCNRKKEYSLVARRGRLFILTASLSFPSDLNLQEKAVSRRLNLNHPVTRLRMPLVSRRSKVPEKTAALTHPYTQLMEGSENPCFPHAKIGPS
ncbi:hypothetical protein M513_02788 [Trichuris suis]|uniref:Uncharacterized protein n=1 Tax=Trichuris suis TaxID=68888 RepID=A0A085MGI7_9BILA|nr:hypothetical protein M513_02788 [Trichuris suis]